MCVLCHTPQNVDTTTGNSLDLKVMVHELHMGKNLPTVVAGTPLSDKWDRLLECLVSGGSG